MKRIDLILVMLLTTPIVATGQTVNVSYLNPTFDSGIYKYFRLGTAEDYKAGFMWNNTSTTYGNGNDFSIFTYANRDMTFYTGTGNFIVFPSVGGNMGIGTINPTEKLDVNGNFKARYINTTDGNATSSIFTYPGNQNLYVGAGKDLAGNKNEIILYNYSCLDGCNVPKIQLLGDKIYTPGNVGIGVSDPGSWKLAVNGNIRAKEIKVETNWSDFVFEEDYSLPTLQEVENHIKTNGHLKDIPSAKEVAKNGIFLGEMDAKLLQKIEELTLYSIAQEKQLKDQQTINEQLLTNYQNLDTINNKLITKNKELEARLAKLEAFLIKE